MLHSICQQIWKTQQWPQDWKRSVFIPILKKGNAKECSNYCTVALISHGSKVVLKILQAKFQQYMNQELPDIQAEFRKVRGTRDQIANICWLTEKPRDFLKKHLLLHVALVTTGCTLMLTWCFNLIPSKWHWGGNRTFLFYCIVWGGNSRPRAVWRMEKFTTRNIFPVCNIWPSVSLDAISLPVYEPVIVLKVFPVST